MAEIDRRKGRDPGGRTELYYASRFRVAAAEAAGEHQGGGQ
jgi:hypothetical protein